jgi:hypothetical protein
MSENLPPPPGEDPRITLRPVEPDIEIIPPRPASARPGLAPPAPLHILSSLATIALDWIWFLIELPATISLAFLPALLPLSLVLALLDFAAVTLVQHFLADEPWGKAIAKGLVMGIVAGVPYPVFGTVVGVPLAAWAGVREVQKLLPGRRD